MKANRSTSTHIIVKMAKMKDKDRSLKVARENQRVIFKRNTIRPSSAEFSAETLQARSTIHSKSSEREKPTTY